MKNKARFTHSISLTEEQENKLRAVREAHKISIVKILMATVTALEPSSPVAVSAIDEED